MTHTAHVVRLVTTHMTGSVHVYILGWLRPLMLRLSPPVPLCALTGPSLGTSLWYCLTPSPSATTKPPRSTGTLFEYVLTGSHSRALRVKRTGNEEDGYKGQGKGHVTTHLHCGVGRRGQLLQGICHFTWKRQGDWRPEQRGRGMFVS